MSNRLRITIALCLSLLLLGGVSCGGKQGTTGGTTTDSAPSLGQMQSILLSQLAELGIDPAKVSSSAPSGEENAVFYLAGTLIAGSPPAGVDLLWNEVLVGDYDQNSEVGISDLTPLGIFFQQTADYLGAEAAFGFDNWPTGNPQDDGGVGEGLPSADDSGARNWRRARVDGDSNGEVNIADITPIGTHFGQSIDGYRVYRKLAGEANFTMVPNKDDGTSPLTVPRSQAQFDPSRPVLYNYEDLVEITGDVQYYVAPYDIESATEGPAGRTITVEFSVPNELPTVEVVAFPTSGAAPLQVDFTATASDPDGAIVTYEWDFEGDGTYDENTHAEPTHTHVYNSAGTFQASVRVTDDRGGTSEESISIAAAGPSTFIVSGTVVDDGDQPLSGVTVTLNPGSISTTTAGDGTYSIPAVAEGSYTASASRSGFTFAPSSQPVEVTGADVTGVDFVGTPQGGPVFTITGHTLLQTAKAQPGSPPPTAPLGNILLNVYEFGTANVVDSVTSDANGAYTITLPQGANYTMAPATPAIGVDGWFPAERFYFATTEDQPDRDFIDTNNK